jgi:hypothetical protein
MVFNLMKLPRLFPKFGFEIRYAGRTTPIKTKGSKEKGVIKS